MKVVLLINLFFHGYLRLCLKKLLNQLYLIIIYYPISNNHILSPIVENTAAKEKLKFNGSCLIQHTITNTPQAIGNIYIIYQITTNNAISSYAGLENCLFGAAKLTKNPDIDKYKYSGYKIGFDRRGQLSFGGGFGQNLIIFGAYMSSSVHANNRIKDILVFGKGFTQGLDNTKIYAEKL